MHQVEYTLILYVWRTPQLIHQTMAMTLTQMFCVEATISNAMHIHKGKFPSSSQQKSYHKIILSYSNYTTHPRDDPIWKNVFSVCYIFFYFITSLCTITYHKIHIHIGIYIHIIKTPHTHPHRQVRYGGFLKYFWDNMGH